MSPMICSSAEPLPSSPAQEALDLLFNCGSTEEASSSPVRGPLTEAELALFDPFSKEGNKLGRSEGGLGRRCSEGGRQAVPPGSCGACKPEKVPAVANAASMSMRSRSHSPVPGRGKLDALVQ